MKWRKSPEVLVQAFDHCLPGVAGVQRKAMFGYPCAFVNGHLFCGLHQDSIIVRLSEARRNALVAKGASVFEPMPGRPMKEYVVAPADIVADREKLHALLDEALAHASSLAAKPRKPSTAKKKRALAPTRKAAPARKASPPKKATPARKAPTKKARKASAAR
jgi:TfoX/Sxy family transcriptional regulator of competence genes